MRNSKSDEIIMCTGIDEERSSKKLEQPKRNKLDNDSPTLATVFIFIRKLKKLLNYTGRKPSTI